jgi:adenylate cyclase
MDLRSGFRLGNWTVYPLEGRLVQEDSVQRIQPKSMDVLLHLAEHAGSVVTRDELLRQVWGDRAQSDEPLTRCVGELRRALGDTRSEPDYIGTIPKRGYQLLKPVRSLEGDTTGADAADRPELNEPQKKSRADTLKKIALAVSILVAAAVVEVSIEKWLESSDANLLGDNQSTSDTAKPPERTIAVLPFVSMSSGKDDGYFADGLTEEILNALTQLDELQVTARTSSFFFKGKNVPVPEIAARLDVAHVVEGSVRRNGEKVRIAAQLVRASDGYHLWSQTYDRTLDDVFAAQEDIAENIAEMLDVVLDDGARQMMRGAGIGDVEAFVAYQKGLEAFEHAHELGNQSEGLGIANEYFDQVLEAAPEFTAARVLKVDHAAHIIMDIADGVRDEEYPGEAQDTLTSLREEYDDAWQLSPPGNERDILDLERSLFSDNWSALRERVERAMQPGRCPRIIWTEEFIGPFGWAEQVADKLRESLDCDPMDVRASYELPRMLIWAGDPEAALQSIEEAEERGIRHRGLDNRRYLALLASGRVDDPGMYGPSPEGGSMDFGRHMLREAIAGDPALALEMAEQYWTRPDASSWKSLWIAAVMGDRERANGIAAEIDAKPGSAVLLSTVIASCYCGAPFDIEATPNYRARIEEADFTWPPPTRIDYPAKNW